MEISHYFVGLVTHQEEEDVKIIKWNLNLYQL